MERERFMHLCGEATSGNDAFIRHPVSNEEGLITSCSLDTDHLFVRTSSGETRLWDYRECNELRRPKLGPMS